MNMQRTFRQFLIEAAITFDTKDTSTTGKQKGREALLKAAGLSMQDYAKMKPYFKKATAGNFMSVYNAFVSAFPAATSAINSVKPEGVGPGEMVMYFVFDNVGIGGKNAAIDIYLDGKEFAETKGGRKRGSSELNNFKVTKDGDKAVTQLLKDLAKFNDKYEEITGGELPGWKGSGAATTDSLRDWKKIDLKKLAKETKGGSKKNIDLVLKKDGDLLRKGESDPLMNVKTGKSITPIKKLVTGESTVAVDDAISTIDKIIQRWVDQAFSDYISGKKFALVETGNLKLRYFGTLSKDMLGLDYTNRNQPYAVVNLEPTKSKEKSETKE